MIDGRVILMRETIKPLYMVADKNVSVNMNDKEFDGIACVQPKGNKNKESFHIRINQQKAKELFNESWARNVKVPFDDFLMGLLFHEVSHIKYGAFKHTPPVANKLFLTIHNILLDSQGEYSVTKDYPTIVRYIRLIVSVLNRTTDLNTIVDGGDEIDKVVSQEKMLFNLARFGIVTSESDPAFINFCLPLVLAATRGDVTSVFIATKAIYEYMLAGLSRDTIQKIMNCKEVVMGVTMGDMEAAQKEDSLIASSTFQIFEEMKDGGVSIGQGNTQIETNDKESAFYRETVLRRIDPIQRIRAAFKKRLDTIQRVDAMDGDFNFSKQQRAYIASFTQEAEPVYSYYKRKRPSVDIVIVRDVSISTSSHADNYAQGVVVLLAALYQMEGIRLAQIDFSDDAMVNLHFDARLNEASIIPNTVGGTSIMPAYNEMKNMKWQAKNRYCVVLTDGGLSDAYAAKVAELKMSNDYRIQFEKYHLASSVSEASSESTIGELKVTSFDTFHKDILSSLMKKIMG